MESLSTFLIRWREDVETLRQLLDAQLIAMGENFDNIESVGWTDKQTEGSSPCVGSNVRKPRSTKRRTARHGKANSDLKLKCVHSSGSPCVEPHKSNNNDDIRSTGKASNLVFDGSTSASSSRLERDHNAEAFLSTEVEYQLEDEVYLTRYLQSYKGNIQKCVGAIVEARRWRNKNVSFVRRARLAARNGSTTNGFPDLPPSLKLFEKVIRRLLPAAPHGKTIDRQPIVVVRFGISNIRALFDSVPHNIIRDFMVFSNEWEFWHCDYQTRVTGYIHKCHRLIDMSDLSLRTIDQRIIYLVSETSKMTDILHPQMTAKTLLLNVSPLMKWALTAMEHFGFTSRSAGKFHVVKKSSESPADDLFVASLVPKERVPTFLGGFCNCEDGCVPGVPNDRGSAEPVDIKELQYEVEKIHCSMEKQQNSSRKVQTPAKQPENVS